MFFVLARLAPEINSGQSFEKEGQPCLVGLVLVYVGYQVFR